MKKHVNLIKEMSDFIGSRSELTKTESKKLITEFFENFKDSLPPAGESAANIAHAGESCSPTAGPNQLVAASPMTTHATKAKAVIATA